MCCLHVERWGGDWVCASVRGGAGVCTRGMLLCVTSTVCLQLSSFLSDTCHSNTAFKRVSLVLVEM